MQTNRLHLRIARCAVIETFPAEPHEIPVRRIILTRKIKNRTFRLQHLHGCEFGLKSFVSLGHVKGFELRGPGFRVRSSGFAAGGSAG